MHVVMVIGINRTVTPDQRQRVVIFTTGQSGGHVNQGHSIAGKPQVHMGVATRFPSANSVHFARQGAEQPVGQVQLIGQASDANRVTAGQPPVDPQQPE